MAVLALTFLGACEAAAPCEATGAVEVVSGSALGPHLGGRDYELAVLSITSCLEGGNVVEAVREGVLQLAQRTRPQLTLHLDEPA